jgi:uncharacterized protein YabE (DUF348 family)
MRIFNKLTMRYVSHKRKRFVHLKQHPFIVPVVTLFVLLFATAIGLVVTGSQTSGPSDSHIVIVSYDKHRQTVPTRANTVGDLLKRINVSLRQGDIVEPAPATPIVEDNFRVNVYRAKPVTIVDNGQKTSALSAATTPRSIVKQAGVAVYPEDDIHTQIPQNILRDNSVGQEVIISRSVPVYLNLYGQSVPTRTHSKTVKDLLAEKDIKLGEGETVQPDVNMPIQANQQIFVNKKDIRVETVASDIPYPTQVVEDSSLSFGTTALRQQGSVGKQIAIYQINVVTGAKTQLQAVVAQPPLPEIVARGKAVDIPADKSGIMAAAGIPSSDYGYVNYIISRESGWCPTKLQGQVGYCPAYAPATIPNGVGYGLGQATPGSKMASAGADWQTNPITQLKWATSYANSKFGGWSGAYNYWQSHHNW